jgi:glutamine amidotransferase
MQWNQINLTNSSPLLEGLEGEWFYFVHSYALGQTEEQNIAIATCDYRSPVIAAVQKELVFGTQFHPEKSGKAGRLLLRNFISICENLI